jgi:hypothetical protein
MKQLFFICQTTYRGIGTICKFTDYYENLNTLIMETQPFVNSLITIYQLCWKHNHTE